MIPLRQCILIPILATVGALAWWYGSDTGPRDTPSAQREGLPDYTVDNLSATIMSETGSPARHLTSRELRHFPADDSTELEQPVLTVFDDATPPWVIRSAKGWLSGDGEDLRLKGRVFIDREAGETTRPLHMRTNELLLRPRQDYAETFQPLLATSGADWLTSANGARIWYGTPTRVELAGPVRTQHDIGARAETAQPTTSEETP